MAAPAVQKPSVQVSLLSRKEISFSEAGLTSVEGARRVIQAISCRAQVTTLALNHNHLGDEGCIELFSYLCSPEGRKYQIKEISLVHNHLGDRSLLAISVYLRDNTHLKELRLQYNAFGCYQDVVTSFTEALNTSQLETLSLSTNSGNGDNLISHLVNTLDSPTLKEIQASMADLTYDAVPHIVTFISSRRCRVHTIRASGNRLGMRSIREIVEAVERYNYSLSKFDLFANWTGDPDDDAEAWKSLSDRLKKALSRNDKLKRETERGAFILLRYARSVLLRTSAIDSSLKPEEYPTPTARIPTELQLHILSFLAPTLSTAQRLRIFNFAATSSTLPRLSPAASDPGCIPDPASLFGGPGALGGFNIAVVSKGGSSGCASGRCMGTGNSLMCRREGEKLKWLAQVGCVDYDPDP